MVFPMIMNCFSWYPCQMKEQQQCLRFATACSFCSLFDCMQYLKLLLFNTIMFNSMLIRLLIRHTAVTLATVSTCEVNSHACYCGASNPLTSKKPIRCILTPSVQQAETFRKDMFQLVVGNMTCFRKTHSFKFECSTSLVVLSSLIGKILALSIIMKAFIWKRNVNVTSVKKNEYDLFSGLLELFPAVIGREAGYTLDRLPVHHRATQRQTTMHAHTLS